MLPVAILEWITAALIMIELGLVFYVNRHAGSRAAILQMMVSVTILALLCTTVFVIGKGGIMNIISLVGQLVLLPAFWIDLKRVEN